MPDQPRPSRASKPVTPPPATDGGTPDRQALLKAYQDVIRSEAEKQHEPPKPPKPPSKAPFWISMLVLVGGLVAILVTRPVWLFPRAPEEPAPLREATLRVRMYVEIEHIELFRQREGRLPTTLQEALGDTTGVHYSPGEGGYSLTGYNTGLSLTYASSQSPKEFLGNAYDLIRRRGKP